MESSLFNDLITNVTQVLERWYDRFETEPEFRTETGLPRFKLVTVGGMALKVHIPDVSSVTTRDLDLKLVVNECIEPDQFYHKFVSEFNPLRTRMMTEIRHSVNRYAVKNASLFSKFKQFVEGERFAVGIAYKCPYLIYSKSDAYRCAKRYPNMVHMVFSVLYHLEGEDEPRSLVDLSMFVNINNPDFLYGRTLENKLYLQYKQDLTTTSDVVPTLKLKVRRGRMVRSVVVETVGFLVSDLYWLSRLHHREDRRVAAHTKLHLVLDHLLTSRNGEVVEFARRCKELSVYVPPPPKRERAHSSSGSEAGASHASHNSEADDAPDGRTPDRKNPVSDREESEATVRGHEELFEIAQQLTRLQRQGKIPVFPQNFL